MVTGHEHLIPDMQADDKDKDVLAAAVHSNSDVLVTENTKDFNPPSSGRGAMRVERTSQFLNHAMDNYPQEIVQAMHEMVDRNRREPRTMPELIDRMAAQRDLAGFARQLNAAVPPEQRGASPDLAPGRDRSPSSVALDGLAPPQGAAQPPSSTQQTRSNKPGSERGPTRGT